MKMVIIMAALLLLVGCGDGDGESNSGAGIADSITINAQTTSGDIQICIIVTETGQIQTDATISVEACRARQGIPLNSADLADIGLSEAEIQGQQCLPGEIVVNDDRGLGCSDGSGGFRPLT